MPRTNEHPTDEAIRWIDEMLASYAKGIAIAPDTVDRLKTKWGIVRADLNRRIDDHR